MEEDSRKNQADIVKARRCAAGLLKNAKIISAPITINALLGFVRTEFDVTVAALPQSKFGDKGDAMTQQRGKMIFIIYNDDRPEVRKRFSVAHELGHLYMGHLHRSSSIDLNTDNFDEIEANAFAANILMPKKLLLIDIKVGLSPDDLAKKYNVSKEALWLQLTQNGLINALSTRM